MIKEQIFLIHKGIGFLIHENILTEETFLGKYRVFENPKDFRFIENIDFPISFSIPNSKFQLTWSKI